MASFRTFVVGLFLVLSLALGGCSDDDPDREVFIALTDLEVIGHFTQRGLEGIDTREPRDAFFVTFETRGFAPNGYTVDVFLVSLSGRNAGAELRVSSLFCDDPFGGDDCGIGFSAIDCGFFQANNGARRLVCPRANVAFDGVDPSAFFAQSEGLPGTYLLGVEACVTGPDRQGRLREACDIARVQEVLIR